MYTEIERDQKEQELAATPPMDSFVAHQLPICHTMTPSTTRRHSFEGQEPEALTPGQLMEGKKESDYDGYSEIVRI